MASETGLADEVELKRSTSSWLSWRSNRCVVQDSLRDYILANGDVEARKLLDGYKKIVEREVGPRLPSLVWCGDGVANGEDDEPIYIWLMRVGDSVALTSGLELQFW